MTSKTTLKMETTEIKYNDNCKREGPPPLSFRYSSYINNNFINVCNNQLYHLYNLSLLYCHSRRCHRQINGGGGYGGFSFDVSQYSYMLVNVGSSSDHYCIPDYGGVCCDHGSGYYHHQLRPRLGHFRFKNHITNDFVAHKSEAAAMSAYIIISK